MMNRMIVLSLSTLVMLAACGDEPEPPVSTKVEPEQELTKKQVEPELPTFEAETPLNRPLTTTDEIRGLVLSEEQRTVMEALGGVAVPGKRGNEKPLNSAVIGCIEQLSLESRGMPVRYTPRVMEACESELLIRLESGDYGVTVDDLLQPDTVELVRAAWDDYESALADR